MSSTDIARGDGTPTARPMAQTAVISGARETPAAASAGVETVRRSGSPASVRADLRYFTSELRITFFRRRNQLLLLVTALFPLLIGIGLKVAAPQGGGRGGGGPSGATSGAAYFSQLAGNGVFLTFVALSLLLILVLPMVVGVIAGDSVAGEAGYGTLRYLLAVPAGRTRLLAVKYATIAVWAVAATFVVSVVALVTGVALFGAGPVTLLSGTTVSLADGLVHVLWVTLYVCAAMAALGAIGLAISTFTEHAIGAIAALLVLVVASEVVENIPQFAPVTPYLPTDWWLSFDSLLRTPIDTYTLWHGLLSFAVYAAIFLCIAWARFTSADVTS